jgi:hypothetical protein
LEETVVATTKFLSIHATLEIAVGGSRVRPWVAVKDDCTCDVAVIVTVLNCWLAPGMTAGAVYSPPDVIDPKFDPLGAPVGAVTLQLTSVLLRLITVAVHCEVPSRVTSVGVQDIVIDGVVAVELDPQELKIPTAASKPTQSKRRPKRTLPHPKWKFDSSTRNPPGRFTLIFLRKARFLDTGGLHAPAFAHPQPTGRIFN